MPSISEISQEVGRGIVPQEASLFSIRNKYLGAFAEQTGRHVIAYYSCFLQRSADQAGIDDLDINGFMEAVCGIKAPDRAKGLDLILHTPGGGITATEAVVNYLHSLFGGDIRCFVPQLAMSAGTMIACSCKEIHMGRQSSLGPIDPQINGVACHAVVEEFETAAAEITADSNKLAVWRPIIEKYDPTYLGECQKAIELSEILVKKWLGDWMFPADSAAKAAKVVKALNNHKDTKTHGRHIGAEEAERIGLNIKRIEEDNALQDLLLSVHHAYMLTFNNTNAVKLVESNRGKNFVLNECK